MQLIIPQVPVRIRAVLQLDAGRPIHHAVVLVPPNALATLLDIRPIEIYLRIIVDIPYKRIRIEHREFRAGIAVRHQQLKRGLVLEDFIDGRRRLVHRLRDLRVVRPFLRPVLVVADAVQGVVCV